MLTLAPDVVYPPEFGGVEGGMEIAGTTAERYLRSISFRNRTETVTEEATPERYGFESIELVLSFHSSDVPPDGAKRRKVDVIVARPELAPLACILNFHSSTSKTFSKVLFITFIFETDYCCWQRL